MKDIFKKLTILSFVLILSGAGMFCSKDKVESNDKKVSEVKKEVVLSGEELMKQKCQSCHKLYMPADYSKEKWKSNVERMSSKASLSEQQEKSLIDLNS